MSCILTLEVVLSLEGMARLLHRLVSRLLLFPLQGLGLALVLVLVQDQGPGVVAHLLLLLSVGLLL
jgi:hypothetical protein